MHSMWHVLVRKIIAERGNNFYPINTSHFQRNPFTLNKFKLFFNYFFQRCDHDFCVWFNASVFFLNRKDPTRCRWTLSLSYLGSPWSSLASVRSTVWPPCPPCLSSSPTASSNTHTSFYACSSTSTRFILPLINSRIETLWDHGTSHVIGLSTNADEFVTIS